jgi:hypothetical protein
MKIREISLAQAVSDFRSEALSLGRKSDYFRGLAGIGVL